MKIIKPNFVTLKKLPDSHFTFQSLLLGLVLVGVNTHAWALTTYTMVDLNKVATPFPFIPNAFGPNGEILGDLVAPGPRPFERGIISPSTVDSVIYANGRLQSIAPLTNGKFFYHPNGMNKQMQIAGVADQSIGNSNFSAFVRNTKGAGRNYGTGSNASSAQAINDNGQVLINSGSVYLGSTKGGSLLPIGSLPIAMFESGTFGSDMNANGQIVGISNLYPFVSLGNGQLKDLVAASNTPVNKRTCAPAYRQQLPSYGIANAINDSGLVAGAYTIDFTLPASNPVCGVAVTRPIVWNTITNTYTAFAMPYKYGFLSDINSQGQVVGQGTNVKDLAFYTAIPKPTFAVIGDAKSGQLINLNPLVINKPSNLVIYRAVKINNAGQILARAIAKGADLNSTIDVLLTPTTTSSGLPTAVSALKATAASSKTLNLSWVVNAAKVTEQYLERCAGKGCINFTRIATLPGNQITYLDSGLTPLSVYRYRIQNHSASAGDSAYSNIAELTMPAVPTSVPTAPSSLGLDNYAKVSYGSILLKWNDNSDNEINFLIERSICYAKNCSTFSQIAFVAANSTGYDDPIPTGTLKDSTFKYRVRAVNEKGKSAFSNIFQLLY